MFVTIIELFTVSLIVTLRSLPSGSFRKMRPLVIIGSLWSSLLFSLGVQDVRSKDSVAFRWNSSCLTSEYLVTKLGLYRSYRVRFGWTFLGRLFNWSNVSTDYLGFSFYPYNRCLFVFIKLLFNVDLTVEWPSELLFIGLVSSAMLCLFCLV